MNRRDLETAKLLGIPATPETKQAIDSCNSAIDASAKALADQIDKDFIDMFLTERGIDERQR
jgi:hypothetical protein